MNFAHPTLLFGLLALPLVALAMGWILSLRRRRLARFTAEEFWPSVAGSISWRRRWIKSALRLGAVGFLVVAAARPQWGVKERPLVREGSDIMICLDVSTSMLARDIAPSRLERAKEQIRSLIYNLKGDRVGLVLFAGDAYVQCPLTLDYPLAVDLLQAADTGSVSVELTTTVGLTNLDLLLHLPNDPLTNLELTDWATNVLSANVTSAAPGDWMLTFNAASGQCLQGTQAVARLSFQATHMPSGFVPLVIANANALQSDGSAMLRPSTSATWQSTLSPSAWPTKSFSSLKLSTSM